MITLTAIQTQTDLFHEVESPLEKIATALSEIESDILIGPEWLFNKKGLYSRGERELIVEELQKISKEHDTLIVPGTIAWRTNRSGSQVYINSTTVLHKGEVLKHYTKRFRALSGCDDIIARHYGRVWHQGKRACQLTWKDKKISVQICSDYCCGPKPNTQNDIHIVTGCGLDDTGMEGYVAPGGYIVFVDGQNTPSSKVTTQSLPDETGRSSFTKVLACALAGSNTTRFSVYRLH